MEAAPLIKAHDHAREASVATHTADTVAAVTEHALAAGEFATAARDTSSVEALRTLRLLEQHHQRLSQLLRHSLENPLQGGGRGGNSQKTDSDSINEKDGQPDGDGKMAATPGSTGAGTVATTTTSVSGVVTRGEFAGGSSGAEGAAGTTVTAGSGGSAGSDGSPLKPSSAAAASISAAAYAHQAGAAAMANLQQPVQPQSRRYPPSRELSSSIANNLASARGIRGGSPGAGVAAARHSQRGQPAAPSMSNELAPGSVDGSPGRSKEGGGSRAQMQSVLQQQQQQKQQQKTSAAIGGKPSWVPPTPPPQQSQQRQRQQQQQTQMFVGTDAEDDEAAATTSKGDEGFSRFYSRFGSIINRLSAPLAFAGLPLTAEEPGPENSKSPANAKGLGTRPTRPRTTSQLSAISASASSASAAEPDLSQIYSRAALRAIGREAGGYGNANDSFYVVPIAGHTVTYANILSFDQKEKRRQMAASIGRIASDEIPEVSAAAEDGADDNDADDDFVDAKERQQQAGPGQMQRSSGRQANRMHQLGNKSGTAADVVVEELYMENQGLKDMLDKLSRRLHTFEASAQQSHMALQESMRFMRPGSPSGGGSGGGIGSSTSSLTPAAAAAAAASLRANLGGDGTDGLDTKTRELEEELARVLKQLDTSERERAHQEKTLQKYREKWEKLRAGAKARRDAQPGPS